MKYLILQFFTLFLTASALAQGPSMARESSLKGKVVANGHPLPFITVITEGKRRGTITNEEGVFIFRNLAPGKIKLHFSGMGYMHQVKEVVIAGGENFDSVSLRPTENMMEEVVVSGTMKAISKMESPI